MAEIILLLVGFIIGMYIWQRNRYAYKGWLRGFEYHQWQQGGNLPRGWDGNGFVTDGVDMQYFEKGWNDARSHNRT